MAQNNQFQTIPITPEMIGLRLDKALCFVPEVKTRSRASQLIRDNSVRVNGKFVKASYNILGTELLEVFFPPPELATLQSYEYDLEILFEDDDLMVINKPAGLVVHPAAGHSQDTLVNVLIGRTKNFSMKFGDHRPGIVHRLDKDTSGTLVVAKNDETQEALANQFRDRSVHRIYFAVVFERPQPPKGKIQSYLARHPTDRKKFASVRDASKKIIRAPIADFQKGKWAMTNYEVLKSLETDLSYIKLKLETGRTHQIRVHLSELGHPIVGDNTYGASKKISGIKNKHTKEIAQKFPRFALHAAELGFTHPKTKESLFFIADWPADLKNYLQELKLL